MDRRKKYKKRHKHRTRKAAKYAVIIKVSQDRFLKYSHINNLFTFCSWLDNHFPTWRYMNVFLKTTRMQVANYTKTKRPYRGEKP